MRLRQVLALLAPSLVAAQKPDVRLPFRASCADCRVGMIELARLASNRSEVTLAATRPARDSRGRYFVPTIASELKVAVFDSTGRFLRTLGGPGAGPGEFGKDRITRVLVGQGDTLFVFYEPVWVAVYSPALSFVRNVTMPAYPVGDAQKIKDGFVIRANIRTPERIGMPMHVLDESGRVKNSFADDATAPRVGLSGLPSIDLPFAIEPDQKAVWLGEEIGFALQRWTLNGQRESRLIFSDVPWIRPVEYFDTVNSRGTSVRMRRPTASVAPTHVDQQGRLWLIASVPRTQRTDERAVDFRIEVLDLSTRTLLVDQPTDKGLRHLRDDIWSRSTADADGFVTFTIYRLSLQSPKR